MRVSLAASSLLLSALGATAVAAADQPMLGAPAPAFRLPSLSGETVALEDFRDRLVVLHFGAGW